MLLAEASAMRPVGFADCAGWLLLAVVASDATAQPSLGSTTCKMAALPGLSRQLASMARNTDDSATTGLAADFSRVAGSILGQAATPGVDWPTRADLPCSNHVRSRDRLAWQMAMLGYSAREIADVLDGHLTRADLDQARARLMAGHPRAAVADFLDAQWREPARADRPEERTAARPPAPMPAGEFDATLAAVSRQHDVPAALVRAMVSAESGGNARAVSPAGAIGLMQLMPATAAALGVDPWQPAENLRGGIAYLAELLRLYRDDVRLALIAYNAGPQHANRVKAGTAVAYRETRRYLDAIAAQYSLP